MEPFKRNGKWCQRVSYRDYNDLDKNGKPKRKFKSKQGFATKRQAKEWGEEFLTKAHQGKLFNESKKYTFYDYFVEWAKTYRYPNIADISKNRYKSNAFYIREYFGATRIDKITRSNFQKFLNQYAKTHAPTSVSKLKTMVKSCLDSAVADRVIPINFALGAEAKGNTGRIRKVTYPSVTQIEELIDAVKEKLNPHFPGRYMILTAIATGMRIGEVGGLTWDCIDFKNKTFKIEKAYRYKKDEPIYKNDPRFKPVKNDSSNRTIKVNDSLLEILKDLKDNDDELVFLRPVKKHIVPNPEGINIDLKYIIRTQLDFELPGFHLHSLRHCHVALLRHYGIEWYAISKRLGHKNLATTLKEYAYLADEDRIRNNNIIATKLNDII